MLFYQKNEGFTLIETLIAIAIFSIGILAVAGMQVRALNSTTYSRKATEAMELGSAHVEYLQGLPFYDENLDLDADGTREFFDVHQDLEAGVDHSKQEGGYTIEWEVEDDAPLDAVENVYSSTGPDSVTVSKTIKVQVFETGNAGSVLSELEMVKIWEKDG